MPIKTKSVVQTGAKSQFGGLKKGFANVGYQVLTETEVKNEPINPTSNGIAIEIKSFMKLIIFFLLINQISFFNLNFSYV